MTEPCAPEPAPDGAASPESDSVAPAWLSDAVNRMAEGERLYVHMPRQHGRDVVRRIERTYLVV